MEISRTLCQFGLFMYLYKSGYARIMLLALFFEL
jgi:hypothetical protein